MRTIPILAIAAIAIASTATAYYFLRDTSAVKRTEEPMPSIGSTSTLQVAALQARLQNMETAVSELSQKQAVSGPDEPSSNYGAENAKVNKRSDADDFVHWMDAALEAGNFDPYTTDSVMDQMETSLAEFPDINLADMQCSERFCRATLIPETGKQLDITQLLGASPFIGHATAIYEPDGSVRVYFVQQGQSFSELRSEAQRNFR